MWRARARQLAVLLALFAAAAVFSILWIRFGPGVAEAVAAGVATWLALVAFFSQPSMFRRGQLTQPSSPDQVRQATARLAETVRVSWQYEASARGLLDPDPVVLEWRTTQRPVMSSSVTSAAVGGQPSAPAQTGGTSPELGQIFRLATNQSLVVLGGPGSGKSTTLLLMALDLLQESKLREHERVPILFPIAGWDPVDVALDSWLQHRLVQDYPWLLAAQAYGSTVAYDLVQRGRLIPLLDGLDELPRDLRPAALQQINQLSGRQPLVVACRTEEFETAVQAGNDMITRAVVIELEPVRPMQAADFLRARFSQPDLARWTRVLAELVDNQAGVVARALSSPLVVSLVRAVYTHPDTQPGELLDHDRFPDAPAIEQHVLDRFVAVQFTIGPFDRVGTRAPVWRWDAAKAEDWLGSLAVHLSSIGTPDFEWWHLQRSMPVTFKLSAIAFLGALAGGIAGAVVAVATRDVWDGAGAALAFGLGGTLLATLSVGRGSPGRPVKATLRLRQRGRVLLGELRSGMRLGTLSGVCLGVLGGGILGVPGVDGHGNLRAAPLAVLAVALATGLVGEVGRVRLSGSGGVWTARGLTVGFVCWLAWLLGTARVMYPSLDVPWEVIAAVGVVMGLVVAAIGTIGAAQPDKARCPVRQIGWLAVATGWDLVPGVMVWSAWYLGQRGVGAAPDLHGFSPSPDIAGLVAGAERGLVLGAVVGVIAGLAYGVLRWTQTPVETDRASTLQRSVAGDRTAAVGFGLTVGLTGGLAASALAIGSDLLNAVTLGLIVASGFALVGMLLGGAGSAEASLRSGLHLGSLGRGQPGSLLSDVGTALAVGIGVGVVGQVAFGRQSGLFLGTGTGLLSGLIVRLCGNHVRAWPLYVLARTWFAMSGRLPWRLASFLQYAHRTGVLRQVGAVYQFRHVRLQERLTNRALARGTARRMAAVRFGSASILSLCLLCGVPLGLMLTVQHVHPWPFHEYITGDIQGDQAFINDDGSLWLMSNSPAKIIIITTTGQIHAHDLGGSLVTSARGREGDMWFSTWGPTAFARITRDGRYVEVAAGEPSVLDMVLGRDGDLWFTTGRFVGKADERGTVTKFELPYYLSALQIVAGSDGYLWFSGAGGVGRISTTGDITPYAILSNRFPRRLTASTDGGVWFSESVAGGRSLIGRVNPGGKLMEFELSYELDSNLVALGLGGVAFTESLGGHGSALGWVTGQGEFSESTMPGHSAIELRRGPDGGAWFTDARVSGTDPIGVGRIGPGGGLSTLDAHIVKDVAADADGTVLLADRLGRIGQVGSDGTPVYHELPAGVYVTAATQGPKNTLWFVGGDHQVGEISEQGSVWIDRTDSWLLPSDVLSGVLVGPNGRPWFIGDSWVVWVDPLLTGLSR